MAEISEEVMEKARRIYIEARRKAIDNAWERLSRYFGIPEKDAMGIVEKLEMDINKPYG